MYMCVNITYHILEQVLEIGMSYFIFQTRLISKEPNTGELCYKFHTTFFV